MIMKKGMKIKVALNIGATATMDEVQFLGFTDFEGASFMVVRKGNNTSYFNLANVAGWDVPDVRESDS